MQAVGLATCTCVECKVTQILVYGVLKCKQVVLQCVQCASVHSCWFKLWCVYMQAGGLAVFIVQGCTVVGLLCL